MISYDVFATFYDKLTQNVEHEKLADYLQELLTTYSHDSGLSLDLACGTGSLTIELFKRGIDIYGIDASMSMLSVAKDKAYDNEFDILFLCQKMQNLDLYGTVDTVFCMLDSINHLPTGLDMQKTFDKVSLFMNSKGIFVFDFNTVYKHKHILSDNTFVYDLDDIYCVWQNSYNEVGDEVDISLDFFYEYEKGLYKKESEKFSEITFPLDTVREMLKTSGFEILDIYDDFSFNPISNKTQRAVFVAQKI